MFLYTDYKKQPEKTYQEQAKAEQLALRALTICYVKQEVSTKECEKRRIEKKELSLQVQDLIAQRQMSRATNIALGVGFFGAALILLTLLATRQGVKVTEKGTSDQLRAYIRCRVRLHNIRQGEAFLVKINILNSGQTPATNIKCSYRLHTGGAPMGEKRNIPIATINPNQESAAIRRVEKNCAPIIRTHGFFCDFRIDYEDIYGRAHFIETSQILRSDVFSAAEDEEQDYNDAVGALFAVVTYTDDLS